MGTSKIKIQGKQIADNTLGQNNFDVLTNTVVAPTNVTTKEYVEKYTVTALAAVFDSTSNMNMDALATTSGSGYVLACNTAIIDKPQSLVKVTVNAVEVLVGTECAFSGDNGVTLRVPGTEQQGDFLYWNTDNARYQLDITDELDFNYLTKG
jgi:hypothetical protein